MIRLLVTVSILLLLAGCTGRDEKVFPQIATIETEGSLLGVHELAVNRNVPWELCWGPDDKLWFTEQEGRVCRLDTKTGVVDTLLVIPEVWFKRTAGLLGMDLYQEKDGTIEAFLNYTYKQDSLITSRLVRYELIEDSLLNPTLLLEIPGNTAHNGSRVKIAHNGMVYWATGDAHVYGNAQDSTSLNGKILRLNRDGSIPADNPIPGSPVWAWGFRNMQGLAENSRGQWYSSEHGEATDDELNLLQPLRNYGWPLIEGYLDTEKEKVHQLINQQEPLLAWTPTIAPAGIVYYESTQLPALQNSILLVTLKAQSLRQIKMDSTGTKVLSEEILLDSVFGRLRSIAVSDKGIIYLSTSNRDWNPAPGFPKSTDDRILQIRLATERKGNLLKSKPALVQETNDGAGLYLRYCASCHKPDGTGVKDIFPSLLKNETVTGDKMKLLQLVLKGKNQMPSFAFLSDEELAAVLSYIRQSWSNESSDITTTYIRNNRNDR
jgi:glucose/arabinose dehydrogenase